MMNWISHRKTKCKEGLWSKMWKLCGNVKQIYTCCMNRLNRSLSVSCICLFMWTFYYKYSFSKKYPKKESAGILVILACIVLWQESNENLRTLKRWCFSPGISAKPGVKTVKRVYLQLGHVACSSLRRESAKRWIKQPAHIRCPLVHWQKDRTG